MFGLSSIKVIERKHGQIGQGPNFKWDGEDYFPHTRRQYRVITS